MQSLRTRKPTEARPQRQKSTNKITRSTSRRATRVDDKIKKRMSMRYADISSPTGGAAPAVPTIPLSLRPGYTNQDGLVQEPEQMRPEDSKEEEQRLLDQDEFDPDACEAIQWARSATLNRERDRPEVKDGEFD